MSTPIYYIKDGNLSFGDKDIFLDIELYIYPGDKICLIGRNGSGKSSLMKVISGEYELTSGELYQNPKIKISHLKQDNKPSSHSTIYEYMLDGFDYNEYKHKADMLLHKLELDGNLDLNKLSGGQQRRTHLARTLMEEPEILLLDEPTNHLDIKAIEWLESYVKEYKGAIICISHDQAFLTNVTNRIWWIDRCELRKSNLGFKYFEQWQEEVIQIEEITLKKLDKKLAEENLWMQQGVTARRKRNQKRLAQLKALRVQQQEYKNHLKSAKAKLELDLLEEAKKSKFIIDAENISFGYQDRDLVNNFSIKIKKGEKIGLIGPNGSGKSTLIKLLTGDITPNTGRIRRNNTLEITYFDQSRTELNLDDTIAKTLCPHGADVVFVRGRDLHIASYLKQFLFDPKILHSKVSTLSGGERNRLLLAKKLINPGNFLILDEPTNDLDLDTLELLLELLAEYSGTLLVVSHDRNFLENLVTRTLIFTDENQILDFIGGYEDYRKHHKLVKTNTSKKDNQKEVLIREKSGPRISYKYIHLLETLPGEIEKLEAEIARLTEAISNPELYQQDHKKFVKFTKDLEAKNIDLEEKISLWLEASDIVGQK